MDKLKEKLKCSRCGRKKVYRKWKKVYECPNVYCRISEIAEINGLESGVLPPPPAQIELSDTDLVTSGQRGLKRSGKSGMALVKSNKMKENKNGQ